MPMDQPPTAAEIAEYEAKLAEYQTHLRDTPMDEVLNWIAWFIFAAVVLGAWFLFDSLMLGFIAVIPVTALMVWGLLAIKHRRRRPSLEWLKANAHRFQSERD